MIFGSNASVTASASSVTLAVQLPEALLQADRFAMLLARYAPAIAGEARDFWISEAGRRLKTSRQRYQDAIQLESADAGGFLMSLNDPLAVAVEMGADSFDMKPGLMGRVVPMTINGALMFRMVTPQGGWQHPGWEGKNILDDVIEEITEVILPKYIVRIVEEL